MHTFFTEYIENLILFIFDISSITIIYSTLNRSRILSSFKGLIKTIPIILTMSVAWTLVDSQTFSSAIISIYVLIFFKLFFNISFIESLYMYVACYVITFITQLPAAFILNFIPADKFGHLADYIAMPVFCILTYILCKSGLVEKLYEFAFRKNKIARNVFVGIYVFSLLTTMYKRLDFDGFMTSLLSIISAALVIGILYVVMYKNHAELRQKQKQLEAYNRYLPIVEDLIEQVRERQHDFNNEIQAIKALPLVYDSYEALSNAIGDEIATVEKGQMIEYSALLKINTKLIAGFLFNRKKAAESVGINLDIDVRNNVLTSNAQEYVLLDVMSILIDNAMEAVDKGAVVSVTIDSDGQRVRIDTLNEGPLLTAAMRKSFFTKGFSTKEKKEDGAIRGIGLYKLSGLTEKYGGSITLDNRYSPDGKALIHFGVEI